MRPETDLRRASQFLQPRVAAPQPSETPSSRPSPYVTAPAAAPIESMRAPPSAAERPVNRLRVAPTPNNAAAESPTDPTSGTCTAGIRNGPTGNAAPIANAPNDASATRT